jgi:hypothetical protein
MKTKIVNDKPTSNHSFPKLMQCNGVKDFIVLMCSSNHNNDGNGIVVSVGLSKDWKLGEYADNWCLSVFSDFKGTLELSND